MNSLPTGYSQVEAHLQERPYRWLVTGAAGFIGSHLVSRLLSLGQIVVGLDNLATGRRDNITDLLSEHDDSTQKKFTFIEGDICDLETCKLEVKDSDFVLHQAALGSVPRSIADPLSTHKSNVTGFLNMLIAANESSETRAFVYASSSSVYGDSPNLPKIEHEVGKVLSPYAASKAANELYADAFASRAHFSIIGLRYFNVFGPRQDPDGPYAAVIPKWIHALKSNDPIHVFGDGETSRDFCYVENAIQANLLSAIQPILLGAEPPVAAEVYNVAAGAQTSLNELATILQQEFSIQANKDFEALPQIVHEDFRPGDVRHSLANLSKIEEGIGYVPAIQVNEGLKRTMKWFLGN